MKLINYIENQNNTGIYCIRNLVNGKLYIGSTKKSFKSRKNKHISNLKSEKHGNEYLQNSFNYHGENSFAFEVLFICPPEECEKHEADFIRLYKSHLREYGYNIQSVSNYRFKYNISETHRKENSSRKKNRNNLSDGNKTNERGTPKSFNEYDKNGKLVAEHNSAKEFVEKNGGTRAHLSKILTQRKLRYYNSIILFSNDVLTLNDINLAKSEIEKKQIKEIEIYDLNENLIITLKSTIKAAKYLKTNETAIRRCCLGTRKFIGNHKTKYKQNE